MVDSVVERFAVDVVSFPIRNLNWIADAVTVVVASPLTANDVYLINYLYYQIICGC